MTEDERKGATVSDQRLVRRTDQRMIAGVAAGVGEYLGADPTLIRLAFVALAFFGGFGIALYLVMWLIVPKPEHVTAPPRDVAKANVDDLVEEARRAFGSVRGAARGPGGAGRDAGGAAGGETDHGGDPGESGQGTGEGR